DFALCAVVLDYPAVSLWRAHKKKLSALLLELSLSFVINLVFVNVSRTALVTMPVMLAVFAILRLKLRSIVLIACAAAVLGGLAWMTSPKSRATAEKFSGDYAFFGEQNGSAAVGLRLVFWQKVGRAVGREWE